MNVDCLEVMLEEKRLQLLTIKMFTTSAKGAYLFISSSRHTHWVSCPPAHMSIGIKQ